MRRLTDAIIDHLRKVCDFPDLGASKYHVIREVRRDRDGIVYEADDAKLGRRVALKVLNGDDPYDTHIADEARIVARLGHPGIVPVHDVGRLADGRIFYSMKHVSGRRLDLARSSLTSLSERLRIFLKVCDTIAFAHANGVIHRRLDPKNILIGTFGEVLIIGWGEAQFQGDSGGRMLQPDLSAMTKLLAFMLDPGDPNRLKAIAGRSCRSVHQLANQVTESIDGPSFWKYLSSCRDRLVDTAYRWISRTTTRPPYPM